MFWVDLEAAFLIHERQIAEHSGGEGLRDQGRLEAALARPRTILDYEPDADLPRLAAAYAHGIAKGHPFVDGNKRTAFVVAEAFLIANGLSLLADDPECIEKMLALAAGDLSEDEFADWLRANTAPKE